MKERHPELPSILGGDFNMIKSLTEKKGGTKILGRDSVAFQNFLTNMRWVDMDIGNCMLTWNNKRGGIAQVASRFDIFIVSEELFLTGNNMTTCILPFGGSDH